MATSCRRRGLRSWFGLALFLLILVAGIAWSRVRLNSWRAELSLARQAMNARHYGSARIRLSQLAEHWTNDGEVFLLLGQCELQRGKREEALIAWAKVPSGAPCFAQAALLRASNLIQQGRYSPAEETLMQALANPGPAESVNLERELIRLYRSEGRINDARRALRASWCRSTDAAGVLRELWLLDHSAIPVEVWGAALDAADNDDDRVWLGRAHRAILTGRFQTAARWLDGCLRRLPDDPAVWNARLDLALATDDVPGFWTAVTHLPAELFDATEIQEMRVWLAARRGEAAVEQRELQELVRLSPGNAQALERLAVLATEAGKLPEAERLHRRKAEVDHIQYQLHQIMLDGVFDATRVDLSARLSAQLGRLFDARAWAILVDAKLPASVPASATGSASGGSSPAPGNLVTRTAELSSAFTILPPRGSRDGSTLGDRLADLRVSPPPLSGTQSRDIPQVTRNGNEPSTPTPKFVESASEAGLRFVFDNGQTPQRLVPETLSGGVGLLDYDGDGWLDVYCVQGGDVHAGDGCLQEAATSPGDRLFHNRRDGTFEDVTEVSGIAAIAWGRGYGQGVTVGDYDNDGHPDLFVTRLRAYTLYHNRGNGTFEDVTAQAGLTGRRDTPTSAAFADLDNDGDLDLYVCHYMLWDPENPRLCRNSHGDVIYCEPRKVEPASDHVFRNDGGRFVDVTTAAGFVDPDGRGLGVVAADLDDDHRIDLFVANDGTANYLFHNRGNFHFEEIGHLAGVAGNAAGGYQAGMGVACGDLDGDGRPDLMVTNFYGEGSTHFKNLRGGIFSDCSAASGIGLATRYLLGFGIAFADVNNDGRPEIMTANGHVNGPPPTFRYPMPARLYQSRPDGRFVDISDRSGFPWSVPRVGRGLAAGDLDNDGRCDVLIVAQGGPLGYFHNQTHQDGHYVMIRLEGTTSSRDGIGALVTVTAGGRRQVAQRLGGGSIMSANDPRLHFGLGQSDRIEQIEVRWSSGKTDRWLSLPAGTGYCLREGDPTPRPLAGFTRANQAEH
jgi:enediyne biosynthesis protein E4